MVVFFTRHCLAWFTPDFIHPTGVQGGPLGFSELDFVVAWFFRETVALPIFLGPLWDPTISWRTEPVPTPRRPLKSSNYGNHLPMNREKVGDQRKRLMMKTVESSESGQTLGQSQDADGQSTVWRAG